MNWVTFSPNASRYSLYYDLRPIVVDLFALSYMIVYPFVNFPASFMIDEKSVKWGVIINKFYLLAYNCCCINNGWRLSKGFFQ